MNIKYVSDTTINNIASSSVVVNIGVPQVTVLGPTLFVLYVKDVESVTSKAHFTLYADDTTLIISDRSDELLETKCCRVLNELGK